MQDRTVETEEDWGGINKGILLVLGEDAMSYPSQQDSSHSHNGTHRELSVL